ncbi:MULTISPECIES: C50 carotenoid gamma-cyclase subunit beta CrtYh [Micrococcus]|uniref:Lycopene cyclase domain-containing protein n=1 Tax=Micrococcus yunnanensis TaxID=566027 RepID=A0ABR6D251_9MICC|nr:C50 carotenoid gamma-cyclase subunit beta CrtYh [Micrococcus yunnanensis]MCV7457596.1 C50 carotenoid gamma-cyclase subunit beta CrtYh [Micrococcus luteus]MBA9059838.1 lycopene cyclase domain-containing protein [Micrococcus yunnanensis]MCV7468604.1 C50 carotenoid gamma-cyclase subunit beta CrtYh [Micrococcus luteus]MCV7554440.1 C50 carotenoid gamma-cyclase subunit beta CrtYh [Micrococcus luteus]MCV7602300.1 C50 carotenoid gamma-cyclase subunit beta CrtYh [Micrococcus luteus]
MTFLDLVLVFVGFALAVLVGAALVGRVRGGHLRAVAATLVALWALTAVFDNVMIAAGLFDYGHELLVGAYVGQAPVEDFAYPLGSALLLPALWLLLTSRGRAGRRGPRPGRRPHPDDR